jgi:serine/threonine-protein kinase HipA
MTSELAVLLDGTVIGTVQQLRSGNLRFTYEHAWRERDDAYPLSLSLPLTTSVHDDRTVRNYLTGLLPDNDKILAAWGRRFSVSASNPFALLSYMGEDCPGAVQFTPLDRVARLQSRRSPKVEWLTEHDVGARLAALTSTHPTGRQAGDLGYFSLPGAQPKIALLHDPKQDRWGIPSGRTPTTHILKPHTGQYDGFVENEYICLQLARSIGLPAARGDVRDFAGQRAIVVERYDRLPSPRGPTRVHQEDLCQALGVSSATKYENEGGPGIAPIVSILRTHSSDPAGDVSTFLDAIALNWIIGGTDAHAKNYSILIAARRVRLAPLYDIISVLPYSDPARDVRKLKLAMRIGGEYQLDAVTWRQWAKLAQQVGVGEEEMITRVRQLAEFVGDTIGALCHDVRQTGIRHPILKTMPEVIRTHAARCVAVVSGYRRTVGRGRTAGKSA